MNFRIASFLAAIVLVPIASVAATFPASMTVDTELTQLNLSILANSNPLGDQDITALGGSLLLDVEQTGSLSPVVSLQNLMGGVILNDFQLSTILGTVDGVGLQVSLGPDGSSFLGDGLNPATVDLDGLLVGLPAGTLAIGATQLVDFAASPVVTNLPAPTLATFEELGSPPNYGLSLSIPVAVTDTVILVDLGNLPITYTLAGNIVFTGQLVPEPANWLLAAPALTCLFAFAFRRQRRGAR